MRHDVTAARLRVKKDAAFTDAHAPCSGIRKLYAFQQSAQLRYHHYFAYACIYAWQHTVYAVLFRSSDGTPSRKRQSAAAPVRDARIYTASAKQLR